MRPPATLCPRHTCQSALTVSHPGPNVTTFQVTLSNQSAAGDETCVPSWPQPQKTQVNEVQKLRSPHTRKRETRRAERATGRALSQGRGAPLGRTPSAVLSAGSLAGAAHTARRGSRAEGGTRRAPRPLLSLREALQCSGSGSPR